ncbi:hypothetical protein NFJ02_02g75600 [Pycnococcus provasolii]
MGGTRAMNYGDVVFTCNQCPPEGVDPRESTPVVAHGAPSVCPAHQKDDAPNDADATLHPDPPASASSQQTIDLTQVLAQQQQHMSIFAQKQQQQFQQQQQQQAALMSFLHTIANSKNNGDDTPKPPSPVPGWDSSRQKQTYASPLIFDPRK